MSAKYALRGGKHGHDRLTVIHQDRWPDTVSLLTRVGLEPGMRCLDLGCGGGLVAMEIATQVMPDGSVTGVDLDEVKLDLCRAEAERRGLRNLELRVQDIESWEEPDAYDLVYSRFLLHHLEDPVGLMRRMWAAVRQGGSLVVEDADHDGWSSHPPNAAFDFFVHGLHESIDRRGGDHAGGRKLHSACLEAGIPEPQIMLAQSVHTSGPAKWLAHLTLEATADTIVSEGIASADKVREALAELERFSADPSTLLTTPRIFQIFVRRAPS